MAEKKSIYEEALLDVQNIKEVLNANTKEILRSIAKEEIDGAVKESLTEGYEEEVVDDEDAPEGGEGEEKSEPDAEPKPDAEPEVGGEEEPEIPSSEGGSEEPEIGMDADALGGDELDMTGSSDDDIIAIYKKLSGEDEIEIVGDEIHLNITEPGEYIVKKGDLGMPEPEGEAGLEEPEIGEPAGEAGLGEPEVPEIGGSEEPAFDGPEGPDGGAEGGPEGEEIGKPEGEEDEEMMYEIAMDDDENVEENKTEEDDVVKEKIESGIGMSVGSHSPLGKEQNYTGAPKGPGVKKESTETKKPVLTEVQVKYNKLLTEANKLKSENEEFRKALTKFRSMLVETVVFNSNLSYVTKLFMEHSTTKDEKAKIIQRFDGEVTNLKESKRLYKTITSELSSRKSITEAVESKIIKEVNSSSSKKLNEVNAYVDPSTQRIKDLINRVENKDKY